MTGPRHRGAFSASGVFIAQDFRDNLIIDRYDPVFWDMRASKRKYLQSVNSEDALTWNVFRSLRQIASTDWLPALWRCAFPAEPVPADQAATIHLWKSIDPPLGLREGGDEGASEVDVVIETASWVWFIEAKYRSDISKGTTTRPDRDQILRNLDVGSYYAGVRSFYFSLLIHSDARSPMGEERIRTYGARETVASLLPHRIDGLKNLEAVSRIRWDDLGLVLGVAGREAVREDERDYARRALMWLRKRDVIGSTV